MCGVTEEKLKELAIPFSPNSIRWRVGATNGDKTKGLVFPYIESRHVMYRLDEICGQANWRNEFKDSPLEGGILCGISINIKFPDGKIEWVTKWDGAESKGDEGVKGGISDSMKRTAVQWGIGRYLYALPKSWVEIIPSGKSHKMKGNPPALPKWALPPGDLKPGEKIGEQFVSESGEEYPEEEQNNGVSDSVSDNIINGGPGSVVVPFKKAKELFGGSKPTVAELVEKDPDYCEWIAHNTDGDIADAVTEYLKGLFDEPQSDPGVPVSVKKGSIKLSMPEHGKDWKPISAFVELHPDITGKDMSFIRKENSDDALLCYEYLKKNYQ